eukprot:2567109-Prymnesium_polylepis.1
MRTWACAPLSVRNQSTTVHRTGVCSSTAMVRGPAQLAFGVGAAVVDAGVPTGGGGGGALDSDSSGGGA